jgi:hypothetical protein
MGQLLAELNETVPHFVVQIVCGLVVIAAQIVFLWMALRARRACLAIEDQAEAGDLAGVREAPIPHVWTDVICALSTLLVPAEAVWVTSTARTEFFDALNSTNVAEKAQGISHAIGGMLNVIPWSIDCFVPTAFLAIISLTLSISSRARIRRIKVAVDSGIQPTDLDACRGPGADNLVVIPAAFFLLGIVPIIAGVWSFSVQMLHGFQLKSAPVGERAALVFEALERAHADFTGRAALAVPGTLLAAGLAFILISRWWKRRPGVPCPMWSWQQTMVVSLPCLLGALALWLGTAAYRGENRMPWPPPRLHGDNLLLHDPQSPALYGVDPVERAPVLWISQRNIVLDGYAVDEQALDEGLRTMTHNYRLLNPQRRFRGSINILCSSEIETAFLARYLQVAQRAGYLHPTFVFTKRDEMVRPILGKQTRVFATGARAVLMPTRNEGEDLEVPSAEPLRLDAFKTFGELARRLVELREADADVVLVLDAKPL